MGKAAYGSDSEDIVFTLVLFCRGEEVTKMGFMYEESAIQDKDYKVAFVILHYLSFEVTDKCVQSVIGNLLYKNCNIVIVDNGSPNDSGKLLREKYANYSQVDVILIHDNLGFSKGNNVGYQYAKRELSADFIIVINNDVIIKQGDFVERSIGIWKQDKYHVLGPDIVNLKGVHQSPQRNHIVTKREAIHWYMKRLLFFICLVLVKPFKKNVFRAFLIDKYNANERKRIEGFIWNQKQENVELQGACFIFSPEYLKNNDKAFEELTFMYGEEATLAWKCMHYGWKIEYSPELQIDHAEKVSTSMVFSDTYSKLYHYSKRHLIAIRKLLKYIRDTEDKNG